MVQLIPLLLSRKFKTLNLFQIVGYIFELGIQMIRNMEKLRQSTQSKPSMNILFPTFIWEDFLEKGEKVQGNVVWRNPMRVDMGREDTRWLKKL